MIGREGVVIGDHDKKRVLLVEDDFYVRSLYSMELESAGFRLFEADSATAARRVLADEEIDFIILDIMLPGERGSDFLGWLKKHPSYKKIPVIMLTNVGDEETTQRCLELGASSYLLKSHAPPKNVVEKVEELIAPAESKHQSSKKVLK